MAEKSSSFLAALVLTILIETAVALLIGYRDKFTLQVIVLINIITNPLLNFFLFVNGYLGIMPTGIAQISLVEFVIVIVEWGLLFYAKRKEAKRLFFLAFAMNFCSFLIGFVVFNR